MIQHFWTIACSRSLIDERTKNISLIDVLEEITLPPDFLKRHKINKLPLQLEVISFWGRAEEKVPARGKGRLQFVDPNGEVLQEQEYDIVLDEFSRSRTRMYVDELPLTSQGRYNFVVSLQNPDGSWKILSELPIQVAEMKKN